jgi:hypothetical protein
VPSDYRAVGPYDSVTLAVVDPQPVDTPPPVGECDVAPLPDLLPERRKQYVH